jgi:general secretion pathway protein I
MRQRGFSLLEVLVAFTILALSLGVLMQIFSGSMRNTDITRDQAEATALAQSLLAAIGVEAPLAAGQDSGSHADKFHWQIEVAPFLQEPRVGQSEALSTVGAPALNLWQVTTRVAWSGTGTSSEHAVTLTTLRAQPPAQP